jgi:hypothetical protein
MATVTTSPRLPPPPPPFPSPFRPALLLIPSCRYKYLGGAYVRLTNCAYCFPCDAERVLKIDCATDEVTLVGRELLQAPGTSWNGMNKWQNGFFSKRDGCVS